MIHEMSVIGIVAIMGIVAKHSFFGESFEAAMRSLHQLARRRQYVNGSREARKEQAQRLAGALQRRANRGLWVQVFELRQLLTRFMRLLTAALREWRLNLPAIRSRV